MTTIKPARVDAALVKSFEDAAKTRGKVSADEVKALIAPRIQDGGKLTDVEKDTLAWVVDHFKLSTTAKRALSDELMAITGQPVFEWQRELKGPLGVRLGTELTKGELDKKAALAFQQNTVAFNSEWGDALFNHPESGNSGTHVSALEGKDALRHLKFLAAVHGDPSILEKYSPTTHAIYTVYESDDEEHFGGIVVDKKTGEAVAIEDFNTVDVTSSLSRAQFEDIFGVVKDSDGRPVSDAEFDDEVYNVDIGEMLGRSARGVELPNFSSAQVARREGPLHAAAKVLSEGFDASSTKRAGFEYGTMARTDGLDARLPTLVDEIQSADWRDSEVRGTDATVREPFRPLDASARATLVATMQAVNPDLAPAAMDALLKNLGDESGLRFARVDVPMQMRTGAGNATTSFVAEAVVVVNEREGDYVVLYARDKIAGD